MILKFLITFPFRSLSQGVHQNFKFCSEKSEKKIHFSPIIYNKYYSFLQQKREISDDGQKSAGWRKKVRTKVKSEKSEGKRK